MNYQQKIRVNARYNKQTIINFLFQHYLYRENGKARKKPISPICLFCAAAINITSEHVLPRWVFDRSPHRFFNTTINGLSHKYNQTTVPACRICNNDLLSTLEKRVLDLFLSNKHHQNFFDCDEKEDLIRWLEILDYKYQVFSLITQFRAAKGVGAIEYLTDFSLSVLDSNVDYSPTKVGRNLRQAVHRITVKSKKEELNSLVTFKTKNPDMHFFHKNNDFLFLELPKYGLALFHFYERKFSDELSAKDAAMEIISSCY